MAEAFEIDSRDALRAYINATETAFVSQGLGGRRIEIPDVDNFNAMSELFDELRSKVSEGPAGLRSISNTLMRLHSLLFLFATSESLVHKYSTMIRQKTAVEIRGLSSVGCELSDPVTPASLYAQYEPEVLRSRELETISDFVFRIKSVRDGASMIVLNERVRKDISYAEAVYACLDEVVVRVDALLDRVAAARGHENSRD